MRVINTRDAAQHVFLIAEGHTCLVGGVLEIDIGIAIIRNADPALGDGRGKLRLVEQLHTVLEVVIDVENTGIGILAEARHGGGDVVQVLEGTRRRLLARPVGSVIGIGQLGRKAGNFRRFPQKLEATVEFLEVLVRAGMGESRVDVIDEGVAAGIVDGHARRQLIFDQRAGNGEGAALLVIIADLRLIARFRRKGRVLGVDEDRAGNGVGALRGGLRAAEDLDAVDIPDGARAIDELVITEIVTVDIDRGARHRAGEEGDGAGVRPLRILSANDGSADTVCVNDVRNILDRVRYGRAAGLFLPDFLGGFDRDGRRRVLHVARHFFTGHDDRFENGRSGGLGLLILTENRRHKQRRQRQNADPAHQATVRTKPHHTPLDKHEY